MPGHTDDVPEYVKKALEYHLEHEPEDYERHGKAIYDISMKWGF